MYFMKGPGNKKSPDAEGIGAASSLGSEIKDSKLSFCDTCHN